MCALPRSSTCLPIVWPVGSNSFEFTFTGGGGASKTPAARPMRTKAMTSRMTPSSTQIWLMRRGDGPLGPPALRFSRRRRSCSRRSRRVVTVIASSISTRLEPRLVSYDRPRPFRPVADRLAAHRQRAHDALQLLLRAPEQGHAHPAHRGYRSGSPGGGRRRIDLRRAALDG